MLTRPITYKDYDGNDVTEKFNFHLSKRELMELEVDVEGGFGLFLDRIIKAKDFKTLLAEVQRVILMSYGVKSEDGKHFRKNDELLEDFRQSAAYEQLFEELTTDEAKTAEFIIGIVPTEMRKDAAKGVSDKSTDEKVVELPQPPEPEQAENTPTST